MNCSPDFEKSKPKWQQHFSAKKQTNEQTNQKKHAFVCSLAVLLMDPVTKKGYQTPIQQHFEEHKAEFVLQPKCLKKKKCT